jgi:TetR/AcrR family transcriptional repressor of multidrug resistance operon
MRVRDIAKEALVKEKAIDLLVKDGFDGFSMNKLARLCNISVATLYIYYRDKDDMIKTIGAELARNFNYYVLKDFSPQMSFREGLKIQWKNRAFYMLNFPNEMACYELLRHSPHAETIVSEGMIEFRSTMKTFMEKAIKNKELVPLSIETYWSIAFGPLYVLLRFHQEGKSMGCKPFQLQEQTLNEAFDMVIKALTPINYNLSPS